VQVIGEGDAVIADQMNGFTVVPPGASEVSDRAVDEF
jgi:hypothetical protein